MKGLLKKIKNFSFTLTIILLIVFSSWAQNNYELLITGNVMGKSTNDTLLQKWIHASGIKENQATVILGNFYNPVKFKLPEDFTKNVDTPLLFAPGKYEWANGRRGGKEMIKDIEDELPEIYSGNVYIPEAACPNPKEVILNNNLVVILIDTYWWVYKHDRRFKKCDIDTRAEALVKIEDAIRRHYSSKHVVIAGHNSLRSYGNSGGYFSLKQSLIQAPYTLYRKTFGTRGDVNHPDYKFFLEGMLSLLKRYPDVIYLSSGDSNLQYFSEEKVHYFVAGSMSQGGFVRTDLPEFGSSENGFGRLSFSADGRSSLIFTGVHDTLFQKEIYHRSFKKKTGHRKTEISEQDSIKCKASNQYNIDETKYFWVGKNYREVWDTQIKVPVFDIKEKKGGLTIEKRGGGQQTQSLRLNDMHGRDYVLRSLEKYTEGVFPDDFKNTFVLDIVQDQISASNPYGALLVAELAKFAGIYHTNPEIVYVPDDPNLGIYRQDVAGKLYLFEERPDDDRSDVASFGRSKDIISTEDVVEEMFDDEDHYIDSDAILRARLFDIVINDWDRHDDQWRWAGFKKGKKTVYKPIPRDRDQVFFVNEGVIPWIAARKWLLPKIQGFDEYTENMEGQSYNARFFDRTFLIYSEWEDWLDQINLLKSRLTSEKIDSAVLAFPEEIQPMCASQTARILKERLKNLEPMARRLYLSLAEEVNVTGNDEEDIFEIRVPNDTIIHIKGYHLKDAREKGAKIYDRTFYASETKRIHIYSFDDEDEFHIEGEAENKIQLTIIGGDEEDRVVYEGKDTPRFVKIYDQKDTDFSHQLSSRIKNNYSENELEYDREAFEYDVVYPGLFLGYNQDDGIFWGGGPVFTKYSRYFRQKYKIFANYAFETRAFNLLLAGKHVYPLNDLELNFSADIKAPRYVNNFFGMGNETSWLVNKSEKQYYWLRMEQYLIKGNLTKKLPYNPSHNMGLDVFYKYTHVEDTPNRFISDLQLNGLPSFALERHNYVGISLKYRINTLSDRQLKTEEEFIGSNVLPTKGFKGNLSVTQHMGLDEKASDFTKFSGDLKTYLSFAQRPRFVYAFRLGGEKIWGDYVFHEAAKLGQKTNLRGFRRTRFYGDASLYTNTEVRIRLKQFKTYLLNGISGVTLFHDVGRVWLEEESSSQWHQGYGMSFWLAPFDMALFNVSYSRSNEDDLINVSLHYQF